MAGNRGKCRFCKADIVWAINHNNKGFPMDPDPVPDGNIVIESYADDGRPLVRYLGKTEKPEAGVDTYQVHFASCEKDSDRQAQAQEKATQ